MEFYITSYIFIQQQKLFLLPRIVVEYLFNVVIL